MITDLYLVPTDVAGEILTPSDYPLPLNVDLFEPPTAPSPASIEQAYKLLTSGTYKVASYTTV